ncbi:MAG: hypothetical protein F6K19_41905 [Cyanothece sp. SIO1E1]|nr:hypothetical protein [Cyanothece sp. SIO1E1]
MLRYRCLKFLIGFSLSVGTCSQVRADVVAERPAPDSDNVFEAIAFVNSPQVNAPERIDSFQSQDLLIAAPENLNPGLKLPPPPPELPPEEVSSPEPEDLEELEVSGEPFLTLENLTVDFRRDTDNFGQINQFIEPTAQFRLRNGERLSLKTGFNYFDATTTEPIINVPLQVGWQGQVNQLDINVKGGLDFFNRLPVAPNFDGSIAAPIARNVTLSGIVTWEPYKFNAKTLENQITALRLGLNLFWQIAPQTSLFSLVRLGAYSDGNTEQQSFSRLERKFGRFSVATNLFNWVYREDVEATSGYFSPPDFLVYSGEVAWQQSLFKILQCRLAGRLGQQRLSGVWTIAYSYQARCTIKASAKIEADLGYEFSNVRDRATGSSAFNNQSITGQLRINF